MVNSLVGMDGRANSFVRCPNIVAYCFKCGWVYGAWVLSIIMGASDSDKVV